MAYLLFLTAVSLVFGASADVSDPGEGERHCNPAELDACMADLPQTQIGMPSTREELDKHCATYRTGMGCMDAWARRCLPPDGQLLVQRQTGGARTLMHYLCKNSSLRKDFLRESSCWPRVSYGMSECVQRLQSTAREAAERTQQRPYLDTHADLCCARDRFVGCVVATGRASCATSAMILLRRIAHLLAADVGTCSLSARAFCAAPPPPRLACAPLALLPPLALLLLRCRL